MKYIKISFEESSKPVLGNVTGYPVIFESMDELFTYECTHRSCDECPMSLIQDLDPCVDKTCREISEYYPGIIPSIFGYDSVKESGHFQNLVDKGVIKL